MNMLLETLRDPLWQVLGAIIVLAAPFLVIAVRTRDVRASEQQKRRETCGVLLVCLAVLLVMSGWVASGHLANPGADAGTCIAPDANASTHAHADAPTRSFHYPGPGDILRGDQPPGLPDSLERVRTFFATQASET